MSLSCRSEEAAVQIDPGVRTSSRTPQRPRRGGSGRTTSWLPLLALLLACWFWSLPAAACETQTVVQSPVHLQVDGVCRSQAEAIQACIAYAQSHGYTADVCRQASNAPLISTYGWLQEGGQFHLGAFYIVKHFVQRPSFPDPDEADQGKACPENCLGDDPVNPSNGNESMPEVDIADVGTGLGFSRTYNSRHTNDGSLGPGWRHAFSRHLIFIPLSPQPGPMASSLRDDQAAACTEGWNEIRTQHPDMQTAVARYADGQCTISGPGGTQTLLMRDNRADYIQTLRQQAEIRLMRDDGKILNFVDNGIRLSADHGTAPRLRAGSGADTSKFEYVDDHNNAEVYDSQGWLLRIVPPSGIPVSMSYTATGRLQRIASRGRAITLTYNAQQHIETVTAPDGAITAYVYDAIGHLTGVLRPDGTSRQYVYDSSAWGHGLTRVIDERGTQSLAWTYDGQGRVLGAALGNQIATMSLAYQGEGVTTQTDPRGVARTFAFTRVGGHRAMTTVSGPPCRTCDYPQAMTYDTAGHVDSVTSFDGITTTFTRDPKRGLETARVEAANLGAALARTVQTDWHEAFDVPVERRLRDSTGTLLSTTRWTWNTRGQPLAIHRIDPASPVARRAGIAYCEEADVLLGSCPLVGLVTAIDGPREDVQDIVTFSYRMGDDPACATAPTTCGWRQGDLWKTTNALGHVTEILRSDGAGRPLSMKDANGVVTDFVYHPRGWLIAAKQRGADTASEADDRILRFDYTATGQVRTLTAPDGNAVTFDYDDADRLATITDRDGNTLSYTLDVAGERVREDVRDANGQLHRTLARAYDTLGQLRTITDAYGRSTAFAYDAEGDLDTITDALGRVTDHDTDALGRLTRTLRDAGHPASSSEIRQQYDAFDRIVRITDPNGLHTDTTYNGFGDATRLVSPDTGTTITTHDSAGQPVTRTDADGRITRLAYDALGRVATVAYPQDPTLDVAYTWDLAQADCTADEAFLVGRLARMTDSSGSTTYCYNRFGDLTRKVQRTGQRTFTLRWHHAANGRLATMTYPDGTLVDYLYDTQGRIAGIGVSTEMTGRQVLLHDARYHPFGPVAEWTFGNGRSMTRTLNLNGQPGVVRDTAAGGLSLGYEFDAVGNLKRLRNGDQNDPPLRVYGYDGLDRLTEARDAAGVLQSSYAYDRTGNRTSSGLLKTITIGGGDSTPGEPGSGGTIGTEWTTRTYYHSPGTHRLWVVGNTQRSYDAAGHQTAIGPRTVEFNDPGEDPPPGDPLESAAYGGETQSTPIGIDDGNEIPPGLVTRQFAYNAAGRMASVSIEQQVQMSYRYNGHGERVYRVGGNDTVHTVFDPAGQWIGDYDASGGLIRQAIWFNGLPVGAMTKEAGAAKLYYVEADALGTPRVVIDPTRGAQGTTVWRWDLAGESFGEQDPDVDPDGDGTWFVFDLRYPGQQYDSATGFNYNYFRDYDPSVGRYVQSDPIGLAGGVSTYGYVGGNPLISSDPLGLVELEIPGVGTTFHANPGPNATSFRAEHGPAHVHLGANDGPRISLLNFKPFSEDDAKKMTKEMEQACSRLTNAQKNLIRRRAKAVFKRGWFARLVNGALVSSATGKVIGGLSGLRVQWDANGGSGGYYCEAVADDEICPTVE